MSEDNRIEEIASNALEVQKRSFSLIWVVPIVALVVGSWLAYKAISEKGPTITITFDHAEGLEAGKTKIKYRDVEIGVADTITLSSDISKIVITAKLVRGSEKYLTDRTKFWVVRARVRGGSVSGLNTLLSGAYIGIDPSPDGEPASSFVGLEMPPAVTLNEPGRSFLLKSESLGSLDVGAPVYHSQIQVGQVVGYNFSQDGFGVDVQIFIEAPYHHKVTDTTRFWNASGIDITLDAEGVQVHTESMVSIVSGGIAFGLPKGGAPGEEAKEGTLFQLYPSKKDIQETNYTIRNHWYLLFNQSVRGLKVGAPVELYGIKVGEVVGLDLEFDAVSRQFVVPVFISIEPERIRGVDTAVSESITTEKPNGLLRELIEERGLRAELQSGNLLTGQLMVNLDFFSDLPRTELTYRDNHPIVPTVSGKFERLQESLTRVIAKIEKIPFGTIGEDLHSLLANAGLAMEGLQGLTKNIDKESQALLRQAQQTLNQLELLAGNLDSDLAPQASNTLVELQNTLKKLQKTIGRDSPVVYNANKTLEELSLTLNSIRDLMDSLNNRPQSLIFGKEEEIGE